MNSSARRRRPRLWCYMKAHIVSLSGHVQKKGRSADLTAPRARSPLVGSAATNAESSRRSRTKSLRAARDETCDQSTWGRVRGRDRAKLPPPPFQRQLPRPNTITRPSGAPDWTLRSKHLPSHFLFSFRCQLEPGLFRGLTTIWPADPRDAMLEQDGNFIECLRYPQIVWRANFV